MLQKKLIWLAGLLIVALLIAPVLTACSGEQGTAGPQGQAGPAGSTGATGPAGPAGTQGPAGTSSGTISGTVTNSLTKSPLADVTVKVEPAVDQTAIKTDASGKYSATLPIGTYTLTFSRTNFTASTPATVAVVAGKTAAKDVALSATSPVVVSAGKDQTGTPGGTVTLKATIEALNGSTVKSYKWEQTAGAKVTLANATSDTATVTLPNAKDYKSFLFAQMEVQDRVGVQAINPHALLAAEKATFKVTVTTSSGDYSGTTNVTVDLPYVDNGGIENVPTNVAVLVHGKTQTSYSWSVTGPSGSKAALDEASGQNPAFTPDVAGKYTLKESSSGATLDVYAGTWTGVIVGKDDKGEPVADKACTTCHNDTIAPDKFTPWKSSGHAEIFTANIENPAGHWSVSCASCHTVGYDTKATNGGFDEALAKEGWQVPPHGDKGLWDTILSKYPNTAKLANIQCENCHGPQQSDAHMKGAARIDISSDACGACHGEPPRHGRFQQWEESGHGNFELAIDESGSASCVRCHTGQGFLAWIEQGDLTKSLQGANGNATAAELVAMGISKDTAQPITCVVCHDPHDQGKTSGEPNTATVRIEGDTPMLPAGFQATSLGRGAICATCHNTRNGAHNDAVTTVMDDRAPHVAAQADVLMGQNAYFVTVGDRAAHSYIEDSCTNCHMQQSPPPAEFSYNLGGTNHEFGASEAICGKCHGAFDTGEPLAEATEAKLGEIKAALEKAILKEITTHTSANHNVILKAMAADKSDVVINSSSTVSALELIETHGRMGMSITVNGTNYPAVRLATDTAIKDAATGNDLGTLLSSAKGQTIAKAGWNYFLIHGDSSNGIHNPSFTNNVLNASLAALAK